MSFDGRNVYNRIKELVCERRELIEENNVFPHTFEGQILRRGNNERIKEIERELDSIRIQYAIG